MIELKKFDIFDFFNENSFSEGSSDRYIRSVAFSIMTYNAPQNAFHYPIGQNHCFLLYGTIKYIPGMKDSVYSNLSGVNISIDSFDLTQKETPEGFWLLLGIPYDNKSKPPQLVEDELVGLFSIFFGQGYAYELVFRNDFRFEDKNIQITGRTFENPEYIQKVIINNESFKEFETLIGKMENIDEKRKEVIFSTLRWYRKATGQFGVDGFIFLWTSLEVIGKDGTQELVVLKRKLVKNYEISEHEIENKLYIGHLESFRGKVLHKGFDSPLDGKILDYLRCIIEDLVISELKKEKSLRAIQYYNANRKDIIKAVESYK